MSTPKKFPGESDQAYPEIFSKPPPFHEKLKPGMLSKEQFDQFFDQGYILIEKFFSDEEMKTLDGCKKDIEKEVDNLAEKLHKAGKIKNLYEDYDLFHRLAMIEKEFPGANVILHRLSRLPQNFRDLHESPRLLNVVEQLLGTANIAGNPNWNLRCKTPDNDASTVPWHQDNGYVENVLYSKKVITAWIPFLDTNEKNGCMEVGKYGHRKGKVATHKCCWRDTWYIILEEEEMAKTLGVDLEKDIVPCPVPYGGVLLFTNMLPHRSLNNLSDEIRWSADLRFQSSEAESGFFGIKEAIQLRSADDPNMKVNWEPFDAVDRHVEAMVQQGLHVDEFDTTLKGPWMKKWELVHSNKHTDAYFKTEGAR